MFTVYKITNTYNEKFYIGMTSLTLKQRWQRHNNSGSDKMPIYRAIKKYGKESFVIKTLYTYETKAEAVKKEIELIESLRPEYNAHIGGTGGPRFGEENGMFGKTQTDEWKQKKSISMSGANNHMFGRHRTKMEIDKISRTRIQLFAEGKLTNYWKNRPKHPNWTSKGLVRTEEMNMKLRKRFIVLDGNRTFEVNNAKQFCVDHGYNYVCFTQAAKKCKPYRGLIVTYPPVEVA